MLLLLVAEATQQGLLGNDVSITNAALVIVTLIGVDIAASLIKERSPLVERLVDGIPVVLVDDGQVLDERMKKHRIDVEDILTAGRASHGVGRPADIRYAVFERSGGISVSPRH